MKDGPMERTSAPDGDEYMAARRIVTGPAPETRQDAEADGGEPTVIMQKVAAGRDAYVFEGDAAIVRRGD